MFCFCFIQWQCYSYFALLTAVCTVPFPRPPVKFQCFPFGSRSLLHAFVVRDLCFACFASQCYSLGSHKVCCTLVFYFALFSNFCFTCFASQASGLCSVFPSAPVKSVTRFCYALVTLQSELRSTQRVFSVKYLFGEANIAWNLLQLEDSYKFLDEYFKHTYKFRRLSNKFPAMF